MEYRKIGNTKNIEVKKYFLYRHIRLDKNEVFYIGIGISARKTSRVRYYERAFAKTGRNKWWSSIVKKTTYAVEILWESDDKEEIISKEKEFISIYGRRDLDMGTLVNLTDGGEGVLECSEETRKILSMQKIGNRHSAGCKMSEENKKRMVEIHKGNTYWLGKKRKQCSIEKGASKIRGILYTEERRSKVRNTHPNSKRVQCLDNGTIYNSIGECIRELFECTDLAKETRYRVHKNGISQVCNNKREKYRDLTFKFV